MTRSGVFDQAEGGDPTGFARHGRIHKRIFVKFYYADFLLETM